MKIAPFMVLFCFMFLCLAAFAASGVQPPEGTIDMRLTRKPVLFSHQTHLAALAGGAATEDTCVACHHLVENTPVFQSCAADGCHDNLNPRDVSPRSYYLATHKKEKTSFNSCLSCHIQQAGDVLEEKKRLVGCKKSACHSS